MITPPALINLSKPGSGQEPTNLQRRNLIGGTLAVLLSSSLRVMAKEKEKEKEKDVPNDPFIVLLKGLYQPVPVGDGPANNLGLSGVNLSDGSYSRTLIYPVFGIPESRDQDKFIGKFYVQITGNLCAYDLPDGAIAMQFASSPVLQDIGFNTFVPFPDGKGGFFLEGTFELLILDATGIYKRFKGGHNHMVDRLHQLDAAGTRFDEFCFCNISQYEFP